MRLTELIEIYMYTEFAVSTNESKKHFVQQAKRQLFATIASIKGSSYRLRSTPNSWLGCEHAVAESINYNALSWSDH